jgi:hypothetical protein
MCAELMRQAFLDVAKIGARAVCLTACLLALAGCAPTAGLIDALDRNYQGYEELSPKLSPGKTGTSFPYTPGTILPALATTGDSNQRIWQATTDLRCDPGVALTSLRFWQRRAYNYRAGRASGIDAKDWLGKRAGFGIASLAGLSDVRVDVSKVRSYEPVAAVLADLNARASQGCILPSADAIGTIRRVRGVIIGDVRVRLYFEQGVDLIARAQLADQLSVALGFGFARVSESEIVGRNVAFGVKWQ